MDDRDKLRELLLDAHRLSDKVGEGVVAFLLRSAIAELDRESSRPAPSRPLE